MSGSATRGSAAESSVGTIAAPGCELAPHAKTEALAFPVQHLAGLPIATRFVLQGLGIAVPIVWSSEPAPDSRSGIVFDADETRALVISVQAERLAAADLKGFCLRKLHDP